MVQQFTGERNAPHVARRGDAKVAISRIDAQRRILSWDDAARRLTGYPPNAVLGRDFGDFAGATEAVAVARTEGYAEFQARFVCRDGAQLTAAATLVAIHDPQTLATLGYMATIRPLEAGYSVAREVRRDDPSRLLDIAGSVARIGYFRLDLRDRCVIWSAEVKRIHGVAPDYEPTLESALAAFHPDDRERFVALTQEIIADAEPKVFEARIVAADGCTRDIILGGHIEYGPDGARNALVGIVVDVTDRKAAERERDSLIERMTLANRAAKVGIWEYDVATRRTTWDTHMFELYGGDERQAPEDLWVRVIDPRERRRIEAHVDAAIAGSAMLDTEFAIRWDDGSVHSIRSFGTVVRATGGTALRVVGTNWDITEVRSLAEELRCEKDALARSETLYRALSEAMPQLVMIVDADGRLSYVNRRWCEYTGHTLETVRAVDRDRALHPDDRSRIDALCAAQPNGEIECELRMRRHDGAYRWHLLRCVAFNASGQWIAAAIDIEDRKVTEIRLERAAAELTHLAQHDAMTGLPNRNLLMDRLTQALAQAERNAARVMLLHVDLDRFKYINDTLGHAAGDQVLAHTGARIVGTLRAGDTASRVGGDEFVLVCSARNDGEDVESLALRLQDAIGQPIEFGNETIAVGASIGISVYPTDDVDPDALLRKADAAKDAAKAGGRNAHRFYSDEMQFSLATRLEFESELRMAIAARQFVVHYQPMICLHSGKLVGAEALVRWQHPRRGLLPPSEFIGFAEEYGFIAAIGEIVLYDTCRQIGALNLSADTAFRIAVNVSAQQFARADFTETIATALRRHGTNVARLEIEITESLVMRNTATTIGILEKLKALGVKLSLDDFGTGYSSLAYIKNFPIDTLKIDRSFIREIATNRTDQALAKTIITLAHNLGMHVVGEGVETEEQVELLRVFGADSVQGYLISHPLPGDEFERFKHAFAPLVRRDGTRPPCPA